jgi:hypothetical protein
MINAVLTLACAAIACSAGWLWFSSNDLRRVSARLISRAFYVESLAEEKKRLRAQAEKIRKRNLIELGVIREPIVKPIEPLECGPFLPPLPDEKFKAGRPFYLTTLAQWFRSEGCSWAKIAAPEEE